MSTTSNLFTLITNDAPYQDRFLLPHSFAVDTRSVRWASKPMADPTMTSAELLAAAEKDHPLFATFDPTMTSAERILAAVAKEPPAEK